MHTDHQKHQEDQKKQWEKPVAYLLLITDTSAKIQVTSESSCGNGVFS